ncbi:MAG TPA: lipoyl(octanoyl) transferase LipB [Bdellovibrionota bacterium]|nr:lipoyl(octanoyl) transferase LipB [Bdellovibrionota bacterium]
MGVARSVKSWRFLGRQPYVPAWELQEELRRRVLAGEGAGEILVVEHPPTVSLGRGEKGQNVLFDRTALSEAGFEVVETNRGGKVTYHGPGQLVVYPVVDLRSIGMGVKQFVCALEKTMIHFLDRYGISAERKDGYPGAWVGGKKIGSIGIHVRKQVSIHGLALNIDPDLSHFDVITPCGIPGVQMTSMAKEGVRLVLADTIEPFLSSLEAIFGWDLGLPVNEPFPRNLGCNVNPDFIPPPAAYV